MVTRLLACAMIFTLASGQVLDSKRALGLRVNGIRMANFPAASMKKDPISISFDVNEQPAPDLYLHVYHCDRDWKRTENVFINDQFRTVGKFPVAYTAAPAGVEGYRYSYQFQFPGSFGFEEFQFSGNYECEVRERTTEDILARARFFVVEDRQPASIRVTNRQLPSLSTPFNQAHLVAVAIRVKEEGKDPLDRIQFSQIRIVDVYKNREIDRCVRIDADDDRPDTFVEGLGSDKLIFRVDDMGPGNEYRTLDLTDVNFFPQGKTSRARDGADVSRFFHQGNPDRDGKSFLTRGTRYSGYVNYRFELLQDESIQEPVYVKGDFNGWGINEVYKMNYDGFTKRYILDVSMRRGTYDYEYALASGPAIGLEGNDWRTTNVYTALVYFRDARLGGFDRIIGCVQSKSSGGAEFSRGGAQ